MHRRRFLRQSSAALAAGTLFGPMASRALAAARAADGLPRLGGVPAEIGIQLYTLRDLFPGDVNGVLETLKRYGYGEVEFAGYHGRTPSTVRAVLDDVGLAAPSVHVGLDVLRADLDRVIEEARVMGHRYVVVPWLAPDQRPDRDGYLRLADEINAMGLRTAAAGIKMGYHNHDFEFETFGGARPAYDALVERLDPDLAALELDLYWTVKAGHDPVAYFERYPGRFPLWHVKDGRGPDLEMVDVGDGDIDFARLFAHADLAGLEHAFIEHDLSAQDDTVDSLRTARRSLAHVESLRGS